MSLLSQYRKGIAVPAKRLKKKTRDWSGDSSAPSSERRQLGALHVESVGVDVPGADAIQIVLAPWAERRRRGARSGVAHDRMAGAQGAVVHEFLANLHLVKHLNLSVSRPHRLPQFLLAMALSTKPRCGRVQTPRLHLCGRRTLQACASCGASHAARVAAGA